MLDQFKTSDLKIAKELLQNIHSKMQNPVEWDHFGICYEIMKENNSNYAESSNIFGSIAITWPKFSGEDLYPVPCPYTLGKKGYMAHEEAPNIFNISDSKEIWDRENSEYAALRWELLEFAIHTLNETISSRDAQEKQLRKDMEA